MKPLVTLPAHYDGNSIVLDTPFNLQTSDKLLVTVLQFDPGIIEKEEWIRTSLSQLDNTYSEDEPEYLQKMIKEPNPDLKNERRGCCSCSAASIRWANKA